MDNGNFVTVIPVEYPRPRRLYPHSAHQYHDCSDKLIFENKNTTQNQNLVEIINNEMKRPSCLSSEADPTCSSINLCVYLMNNVVLHMHLEDKNNTKVTDLIESIVELPELMLPESAINVFSLWMNSTLLEVQLKPHHEPFLVRAKWSSLLSRFAHANLTRRLRDEPILSFQRNVFYPIEEEQKLVDVRILELLYEEAKCNVLEGRYPCDITQYTMLGGIQARLELGPYNPQIHSNKFFRSQQNKFLPVHCKNYPITSWFRSRIKNSTEIRLLEHYKRIPNSASDRKLQKRYLEVCWSFPFYGCAFFQGQIEEPVRGLTSLLLHQDLPILIGINERGLYLIDNVEAKMLLDLNFEDFSWELGKPYKMNNEDCIPCIFLQFAIMENGTRVSKIMQIFSKQADMVDALINTFVAQKKKHLLGESRDQPDGLSSQSIGNKPVIPSLKLTDKLTNLTLTTLDDEVGKKLVVNTPASHCIGQMGSLKFVY